VCHLLVDNLEFFEARSFYIDGNYVSTIILPSRNRAAKTVTAALLLSTTTGAVRHAGGGHGILSQSNRHFGQKGRVGNSA